MAIKARVPLAATAKSVLAMYMPISPNKVRMVVHFEKAPIVATCRMTSVAATFNVLSRCTTTLAQHGRSQVNRSRGDTLNKCHELRLQNIKSLGPHTVPFC